MMPNERVIVRPLITVVMACVLLIGGPASASTWLEVAGSEKSQVSVDLTSIAPSKGYWKAWVKTTFDEAQDTQTYPGKKFKETKYLQYFNCREKTQLMTKWLAYDIEGNVVESHNGQLNASAFNEVVPDTIGERVANFVCRGKK